MNFFSIFLNTSKKIEQKYEEHFDRIKKSENRFKEYLSFDTSQRIENYEMLRKAIFRIQSILSKTEMANYDKAELLNGDCLYADIYIIPYLNSNHELAFLKVSELEKLRHPTGEYEIVDESIGKYTQDGIERISKWIAIDYSLRGICHRWLEQIPAIEKAIAEAKKQEEAEY